MPSMVDQPSEPDAPWYLRLLGGALLGAWLSMAVLAALQWRDLPPDPFDGPGAYLVRHTPLLFAFLALTGTGAAAGLFWKPGSRGFWTELLARLLAGMVVGAVLFVVVTLFLHGLEGLAMGSAHVRLVLWLALFIFGLAGMLLDRHLFGAIERALLPGGD